MRPMIRFGKKIILESTIAIKHELRERMRASDRLESEKLARELQAVAAARPPAA